MKKVSRSIAAILIIAVLAVCCCGCHEKDETAYTINGHTFTSAMYSCMLYVSASSARDAISTFVSENDGDTSDIKYSDYKFDEEGNVSATGTVSYSEFVKKQAVQELTRYAVILTELEKAGLSPDEDTIESAKAMASYYWYVGCDYSTYQYYAAYGVDPTSYFTPYSEFFEPNGVAYSTYEQYMVYEQYYMYYFTHIYGEGGEKEVQQDELNSYLNEHYAIADSLSLSKNDDNGDTLSDEKLTELKSKADGYAERINAGEAFETVYNEYNEIEEDESEKTDESESGEVSIDMSETGTDNESDSEEEEYKPETYLQIYGDEESSYNDSIFSDIHAAEIGKAVVIDDSTNSRYLLIVRRDINERSYWLDNLRDSIILTLRQDEFEAGLDEIGNPYDINEDTYATGQFKVNKIKFS